MRQQGAFYTPHTLAEFVLNEVLPYPTDASTAYNVRVLDPTCGSGIFLVESLNRLLDRWEHAYPGRQLEFADVRQLVLDNIFGIEVEEEAIKVAAFSLYLAMLDRLDPKTLWQEVHFPYLIHQPGNPDNHHQGHNLFLQSSLQYGPFKELEFDIVVGNPPFTNKVSDEVRAYLQPLGFALETVLAFLHRATELCPTGQIALISTSKILFNTGRTYQAFRRFLFEDTYVGKVFNFSALRRAQQHGGRNLFASAQRPVCLLLYQKLLPAKPSRRLVYCCPTTAVKNRLIDGITLDPSEINYLPRVECQNPTTKIWKTAMWATVRDFELVRELTSGPTLEEYLTENFFACGVGLEVGSSASADAHHQEEYIQNIHHVEARNLCRYHTPIENTSPLIDKSSGEPVTHFRRLGAVAAYKGPHLLIKEGQSDKQFCASYIAFDCSFKDTIYGISAPEKPEDLKLLAAFLNSSFAAYLMFLTSSDWGVERERVLPTEMLSLPSLCFHLPNETKRRMVQGVDAPH